MKACHMGFNLRVRGCFGMRWVQLACSSAETKSGVPTEMKRALKAPIVESVSGQLSRARHVDHVEICGTLRPVRT